MRPLRDALVAVQFLTRIPLPGGAWGEAELGRSTGWFPLVGLLLGAGAAGLARIAQGHLPPAVAAVLLVALLAWVTGGLHLDGVADVFDGLGGGRGDRARTLAIMKDSRIGAHGATALAMLLLAKTAAVAELLAQGQLWPIVAALPLARFVAVPLIAFLPYARPEGLGRAFRTAGPAQAALAGVTSAAVLAPFAPASFVPALVSLCAASLLAWALLRRLGGLTGDVYGACIELAEAAFLVAATAR